VLLTHLAAVILRAEPPTHLPGGLLPSCTFPHHSTCPQPPPPPLLGLAAWVQLAISCVPGAGRPSVMGLARARVRALVAGQEAPQASPANCDALHRLAAGRGPQARSCGRAGRPPARPHACRGRCYACVCRCAAPGAHKGRRRRRRRLHGSAGATSEGGQPRPHFDM